eukprot:4562078-Lingulodinium_polyedra.AAC.1
MKGKISSGVNREGSTKRRNNASTEGVVATIPLGVRIHPTGNGRGATPVNRAKVEPMARLKRMMERRQVEDIG